MSGRADALTKLGLREVELSIVLTIPVTAPESVEDRLIGALSTYAADLMWVREAGFRKPTIPTDDLLFLHNEVLLAADPMLQTTSPGNPWAGFSCSEVEVLACIFAAAGREDVYDFIVHAHCLDDDAEEVDWHLSMYEDRTPPKPLGKEHSND